MGLGPYPEVSLAEARDKARELRKQIRNGINPLQEKHLSLIHIYSGQSKMTVLLSPFATVRRLFWHFATAITH